MYKMYKKLRDFCKRTRTVGCKVSDLYRKYLEQAGESALELEEFERRLLRLEEKAAVAARAACIRFALANGTDSYHKFTREMEYVSRKFWDGAVFQGKQKQCLANDTELMASVKAAQEDCRKKLVELKGTGAPPVPERDPEKQYMKLLPKDWNHMSHADRVEFVRRVQHTGFFQFLLSMDPRLERYFSKLKVKQDFKMYVTLFSIPADSYSEEAKNLLKCFINTLNQFGRGRMQYVECTNPGTVEVREIR